METPASPQHLHSHKFIKLFNNTSWESLISQVGGFRLLLNPERLLQITFYRHGEITRRRLADGSEAPELRLLQGAKVVFWGELLGVVNWCACFERQSSKNYESCVGGVAAQF